MKFKIIDLTSSETIRAKGFPAYVQVKTQEFIELSDLQFGIIEGKRSFHELGIGIFGGLINPQWKGNLTIEFHVFGDIEIQKGQKIAHAIILE